MNWEALLVIGGGAVVLGVLLLIPGLMWARRKARAEPSIPALTKAGIAFSSTSVLVLLAAVSAPLWARDTVFQWLLNPTYRALSVAAIFGVIFLSEWLLKRAGIRVAVPRTKNDA